jgi:hypothetical protein
VRAVEPQLTLAIDAGPDACEDCLVNKELMARHVAAALIDLDPSLTASDIEIAYPGDVGVDGA